MAGEYTEAVYFKKSEIDAIARVAAIGERKGGRRS